MNMFRVAMAYFTVATIICTLLGQMHWITGLILTLFGVWCLIVADQDAEAAHKRRSHRTRKS